jgi:N-acetylmuramoyl-L-alanine amidase
MVMYDPGHGGRDPGAVGPTGLREAGVTLAIAWQSDVAETLAGRDSVMTRLGDDFSPPVDRAGHANYIKPDCFISIHANAPSSADPKGHLARGFEVYHFPGSAEGKRLAEAIRDAVRMAFRDSGRYPVPAMRGDNDGVKTARFTVLAKTKMPAVLVECAFISNAAEEKLLADPCWQLKMGRAIADGAAKWRGAR